ncbi:MAG: S8 family serine peptidase, partial [Acidimicrobiia bacterium]|nr:S8 family serine peptidase [Acidimicrobiia bacterium]
MVGALAAMVGVAVAQSSDDAPGGAASISEDESRLIDLAAETGPIRLLVWTGDGADRTAVLGTLEQTDANVLIVYDAFPVLLVEADADVVTTLASDSRVRGIEEDVAVPPALASSIPVINADDMHLLGFDGTGTVVAILDTGIDVDHPFFAGRLVSQSCFSNAAGAGGKVTLCPNGMSSQTIGDAADAETAACLNVADNLCDHGSHVAGIAAGNATGTTPGAPGDGVAPDAGIMAIQVFTRFNSAGDCSPSPAPCVKSFSSDQLLGLQQVATLESGGSLLPSHVASANMSLSGGSFSSACDGNPLKAAVDALITLNVATVIASGNNGFLNAVGGPSCISTAIAVGATGDSDIVASFSNRGPLLDLFAPGVSIDSSVPDDTYGPKQGTSMAAPHVAGAWAVLREAFPLETVPETLTRLRNGGVSVTYSIGAQNITTPRIDLVGVGTPPPNDDFADAQLITGSNITRTGDTNVAATKEPGEPSHAGNPGGASVWYEWTPLASGAVTIDTAGSALDTILAAYTGSSVGALTTVASNDDVPTSLLLTSRINFIATANTTYRIAVDGFGAATGPITLNLVQVDTTDPTVTVTTPASGATYDQGSSVLASYSCADEPGGSGLASCVGNVPSGSAIDTATTGAKTFTVTGADVAGNSATVVRNYTVVAAAPPPPPTPPPPPPPSNLVVPVPAAVDGSTLTVSWTTPTASPGDPIVSYTVSAGGQTSVVPAVSVAEVGVAATKTVTLTGVDRSVAQTTTVRATSAAGLSSSASVTAAALRSRIFVSNRIVSGPAEYDFVFGPPGAAVATGDWTGDGHTGFA